MDDATHPSAPDSPDDETEMDYGFHFDTPKQKKSKTSLFMTLLLLNSLDI